MNDMYDRFMEATGPDRMRGWRPIGGREEVWNAIWAWGLREFG